MAWAVLLAYVNIPTILSDEPFSDGGISVLGAASQPVTRPPPSGSCGGRGGPSPGLAMGGIGLFGSWAVLVTLIPGLDRAEALIGRPPVMVLAVPAGMAAVYAVIVVALLRTRDDFPQRSD